MKKAIVAIYMLLMLVACGGSSPEETVISFLDAEKAGDGALAVTFLSRNTIGEIAVLATSMLPMIDASVSFEELQAMSDDQLAAALFSSQMMREIASETISTDVIGSTVNGDSATVRVRMTTSGGTLEDSFLLVRESGVWKVVTPGFGM